MRPGASFAFETSSAMVRTPMRGLTQRKMGETATRPMPTKAVSSS